MKIETNFNISRSVHKRFFGIMGDPFESPVPPWIAVVEKLTVVVVFSDFGLHAASDIGFNIRQLGYKFPDRLPTEAVPGF